jgi:hypothetical protein
MRSKIFAAALVCSLGMAGMAGAEGDDAALGTEQQKMDETLTAKPDADKATALADQFKVEKTTVEDLRAKGRGWGETGIELSMAQKLMESDPKTYPTMTEALAKLETMRADGSGWGKIAKDLGMKLGPIVSEARHARNAMRMEKHEMRHERMEARQEKMEHAGAMKAERPARIEKPSKPVH